VVSSTEPPRRLDPAARVDRAFFVDGRLRALPARRSKRLIVLDRLAQLFEPGVSYPESSVNEVLTRVHPDYALLRRCLVDEGFMAREFGWYWRTGGTVPV
jgi:hypothetical protein